MNRFACALCLVLFLGCTATADAACRPLKRVFGRDSTVAAPVVELGQAVSTAPAFVPAQPRRNYLPAIAGIVSCVAGAITAAGVGLAIDRYKR